MLTFPYGFVYRGIDYVYDNIEAAEIAAMFAVGFGDGSALWNIPIFPYYPNELNNKLTSGWNARAICSVHGSIQCAY